MTIHTARFHLRNGADANGHQDAGRPGAFGGPAPARHGAARLIPNKKRRPGAAFVFSISQRSARVIFHDQVRFHLRPGTAPSVTGWQPRKPGGHLAVIGLDVVRHFALGELVGFKHQRELGRDFSRTSMTSPTLTRRIEEMLARLPFDLDVTVIDELAGGEHRRHELGAVDDGVEARARGG